MKASPWHSTGTEVVVLVDGLQLSHQVGQAVIGGVLHIDAAVTAFLPWKSDNFDQIQ